MRLLSLFRCALHAVRVECWCGMGRSEVYVMCSIVSLFCVCGVYGSWFVSFLGCMGLLFARICGVLLYMR